MSANPVQVGHSDTPLDASDNFPMDESFPDASLGAVNPEDIQDEAALFNLDDDKDVTRPNPPQATLENLANMQIIIEQIQGASFSDEETQWSEDEFEAFLHPPHEQFCLDDLQLRLSLSIYISLSSHSSEATYNAMNRSIKDCYPDSMMLSFDQVQNRLICVSIVVWDSLDHFRNS